MVLSCNKSIKSPRLSCPSTLNDLPDNVIYEIVSRLPIKTAIITSLISRFWRSRWKSIPDLVFHDVPSVLISQILLLHSGSIRKFGVNLCEASPFLDSWLVALSNHSALSLCSLSIHLPFSKTRSQFLLNSSTFSFAHLTTLSLSDCYIDLPPDFLGFKCLQILRLYRVCFKDGKQASILISASAFLSILELSITGRGCLEIHGPSICRLVLFADFDDVAFGSCPLLKYAGFGLVAMNWFKIDTMDDDDHADGKWFDFGRCDIKNLVAFDVPKRISINYYNLSTLNLVIDFTNARQVSTILCFLNSCPNLKELTIKSVFRNGYKTGDIQHMWDAQRQFNLFPKLQTVEFLNIMFKESELELARLILETAKELETMTVAIDKIMVTNNEFGITKLSEFRKLNQARIVWKL